MEPTHLIKDALKLASFVLETHLKKETEIIFYASQTFDNLDPKRIPMEDRTISLDIATSYMYRFKGTLELLFDLHAIKGYSLGLYKLSKNPPIDYAMRERGLHPSKPTTVFKYESKSTVTEDSFADLLVQTEGVSFPAFVLYDSLREIHSVLAYRKDLENFVNIYSSRLPAINEDTRELIFIGKRMKFKGVYFSLVKLLIENINSNVDFTDFERCYYLNRKNKADRSSNKEIDKVSVKTIKDAYKKIFSNYINKDKDLKEIFRRRSTQKGGFGIFIDQNKLSDFLEKSK